TFSITTTGPLTAGVGSATFAVNAGTYTITEQVPADFVLSGAGCPAPIGMSPTVTVAVASGGTSSCSYSDTKRATLTVTKNTQGGNGTFTFNTNGGTGSGLPATFTISTTGNVTTGAGATTFGALAVGWYDVSETVPGSVYAVGPTTCPAVVSGGSPPPTCSFTDEKRGQILITENTYGGDGTFTFTLTGGPENVSQTATI